MADSGYSSLGVWTYGYDTASNALSQVATRQNMDELESTRPYCYEALGRQYNVLAVVDRAGAIVERYVYDPYGHLLIR
ncbi:MAG: hypothetical protein O7D94_04490 [Planctomycetota bacterium]|nr:hypothetical protein [Planctomycetota bacterium]